MRFSSAPIIYINVIIALGVTPLYVDMIGNTSAVIIHWNVGLFRIARERDLSNHIAQNIDVYELTDKDRN